MKYRQIRILNIINSMVVTFDTRWLIVGGCLLIHFKNLHGGLNDKLGLNLVPTIHIVVVFIGMVFEMETVGKFTHFSLGSDEPIVSIGAAINN